MIAPSQHPTDLFHFIPRIWVFVRPARPADLPDHSLMPESLYASRLPRKRDRETPFREESVAPVSIDRAGSSTIPFPAGRESSGILRNNCTPWLFAARMRATGSFCPLRGKKELLLRFPSARRLSLSLHYATRFSRRLYVRCSAASSGDLSFSPSSPSDLDDRCGLQERRAKSRAERTNFGGQVASRASRDRRMLR